MIPQNAIRIIFVASTTFFGVTITLFALFLKDIAIENLYFCKLQTRSKSCKACNPSNQKPSHFCAKLSQIFSAPRYPIWCKNKKLATKIAVCNCIVLRDFLQSRSFCEVITTFVALSWQISQLRMYLCMYQTRPKLRGICNTPNKIFTYTNASSQLQYQSKKCETCCGHAIAACGMRKILRTSFFWCDII